MPVVTVETRPSEDDKTRERIARGIREVFAKEGYPNEDVTVILVEEPDKG